MNKPLLRSASIVLAIVLAFGIFVPGRATSQNASLMPNRTVNLAFFYKPPSNSDAPTLASNFGTVVLTGGDESFRDQLAANGFSSTVPQYFRSEGIQNPGNCTSSPSNNQFANRAGDFCDISQNHPDWFLLDTSGNRMRTSPTSNYYRMDYGNAGWRNFVVTRVLETQQQKGWSGVFLDNLEASLSEIQLDGLTSAKYPDDASYQAAVNGFLNYLYVNYSQAYNRPLVANIIARRDDATWFNYIQNLSGAMQESWAVGWSSTEYLSVSKWTSEMALAENTQSQGKFIMLVAQGDQADTNRQNFAFASYLLISNGKAAFRYGNDNAYSQVWLYNNYSVQLGSPLGARYQTGTSWRRDFTNGYVIVDPTNHTATISTAPAATPTSTRVPTLAVTNTPTQVPTIAVTSTATRLPAPTATSAPTIYNDQNAAFVYSAGWTNTVDSLAYRGQYMLTKVIGSYVTFNFTGQSFTIIYKAGPLLGKMEIYVDGRLITTLDQKVSSPTYQKRWRYSGTLATGSHTLKLILVGPTDARGSLDAVSIP